MLLSAFGFNFYITYTCEINSAFIYLCLISLSLISSRFLLFLVWIIFYCTYVLLFFWLFLLLSINLFWFSILVFVSCFCCLWFGVKSKKKSLPKPVSRSLFPTLSFRNFMVWGLTLKFFYPFWVGFYVWCMMGSNSILLHVYIQFSQEHLLARLSFPHCVFFMPLLKINCPCMYEFILKSGSVIFPTLLLLKIVLAIWGSLWGHMNKMFSIFVKNVMRNFIEIALNL